MWIYVISASSLDVTSSHMRQLEGILRRTTAVQPRVEVTSEDVPRFPMSPRDEAIMTVMVTTSFQLLAAAAYPLNAHGELIIDHADCKAQAVLKTPAPTKRKAAAPKKAVVFKNTKRAKHAEHANRDNTATDANATGTADGSAYGIHRETGQGDGREVARGGWQGTLQERVHSHRRRSQRAGPDLVGIPRSERLPCQLLPVRHDNETGKLRSVPRLRIPRGEGPFAAAQHSGRPRLV